MTEEQFWEIVESTKAAAGGSFDEHFKKLVSRLTTLEPEQIAAFDLNFDVLSIRAYSWDLWGAAYVIHGGCSDDSFTDFRSWLISMGRDVYQRALADPESLADIELGPDGEEDAFFGSPEAQALPGVARGGEGSQGAEGVLTIGDGLLDAG